MTWKMIYYGTDSPRAATIVIANWFVVGFALLVYGLIADFLPSKQWHYISRIASPTLALITLPLVYWAWSGHCGKHIEDYSKRKKVYCAAVLLAMSALLYWIVLSYSLPSLLARAIGDRTAIHIVAHPQFAKRKGCDYFLTNSDIERMLNKLCIPENMYRSLPSSAEVELEGSVTYFGLHINETRPLR